jgi:hypothetical protein
MPDEGGVLTDGMMLSVPFIVFLRDESDGGALIASWFSGKNKYREKTLAYSNRIITYSYFDS